MSYVVLNLTCFYVQDSGFGFQRDESFNAEIISTSLARGVPLRRSLCLGLASYLLDHSRISVMMSRSVLCSWAIGCSSIPCERSRSELVNKKTRETYEDQAAMLFGVDHLGDTPESLGRPILVSSGPARGEAQSHLCEIRSFNQIPARSWCIKS